MDKTELAAVAIALAVGSALIISTVTEFIITGRSPFMVLSTAYVAQIWYWMFGGRENELQ